MTIREIIKLIEQWAPNEVPWQKDNPGLQVGSPDRTLENIFLCLELTGEALDEAVKKKCNFIFTHHPFIFQPLRKIDLRNDKNSRLIEQLIKNDITLYSAHTNLDFTRDGVSFQLAKELGLRNIRFMQYQESNQYKLVVFVPETSLDKVRDAIFSAGGGIIGEYSRCGFSLSGTGTFEGSENSSPVVGKPLSEENVDEVRLEVLIDKWKIHKVTSSLIEAHPYEEPAFDIYPLANRNVNYGFGAVGELETAMDKNVFLEHVCRLLDASAIRYTAGSKDYIQKVAVCGGSGSDLIDSAINLGADAFITADVKYHAFQDAHKSILLIDAGHYETEVLVLKEVEKRLKDFIQRNKLNSEIFTFSGTTNPVRFYNI
jgi:dinuclear metal center YbgI/SA1388 family protein